MVPCLEKRRYKASSVVLIGIFLINKIIPSSLRAASPGSVIKPVSCLCMGEGRLQNKYYTIYLTNFQTKYMMMEWWSGD